MRPNSFFAPTHALSFFLFLGLALRALPALATPVVPTEQDARDRPPPAPPHGRVLSAQLQTVREDRLLSPGGRAALYAVVREGSDYQPQRPALVFIHGLGADPVAMQGLLDRLSGPHVQSYVLVYDDFFRRTELNGEDLASELLQLVQGGGAGARQVTLIGHSMGGIVGRVAQLSLARRGAAAAFAYLRLFALDTPWHGYAGPCDQGLQAVVMALGRPLIPDGLEDMRACSTLFVGAAAGSGGLFTLALPEHFTTQLLFAQDEGMVLRFASGPLSALPAKLVQYYTAETPVRGDQRLVNYFRALIASEQYFGFQEAMRQAADAGRLDERLTLQLLHRHFATFAGGHDSLLLAQRAQPSAVDYLQAQLTAQLAPSTAPPSSPRALWAAR